MRNKFFTLLVLFFASLVGFETYAQIVGDYRSFGVGTSWTTAANWERCAVDGVWPGVASATYPGQAASPAGTTVTIRNGHSRILDVSPGFSIVNLAVGEGASGTLTIGNSGTARTLTVTGGITIASGATLAAGGTTSHTINNGGNFTNNGGTFTPVNGSGIVNIVFNGSVDQFINGTVATQAFNNITVNKAGGALGVAGSTTTLTTAAFTQTLGNFNAPPTLTTTGTVTLTAGTFTAGDNLNIGGTTANFTRNGATFTPGTGTVTFTGSGNQAINGSVAAQTFYNLVVNKSANTLSVGGSTTTLNVTNFTRTLGNFTAPATVNVSGDMTLTAGTYTAGATTNITGNFIHDGGTYTAGTNTNIAGNFTRNGGTFTQGANTVTFNGSGAQEINGSVVSQAFNNVVINKAGGALSVGGSTTTITTAAFTQTLGDFNAPATLTTTGTVTLTAGTYTAGANLTIGGTTTNFTNNGGTFTPGTGTVTFTGSGNQAINGTAVTQTFNNLVINKGNTLSTGGSTTTLNIANLTRTAGTFTAPATVNISGNLLLTAGTYTAGANTNIGGDLTNNGGTFTPGISNTVTFNGAADQAINGTAVSQAFGNLVIDKSGSSTVTVGGSVATVTATTLTQTLGNFTAPATVTLTGALTLSDGTYTAGANTNLAGNFIITNATFLPGSGTVTFNSAVAQNINSTNTSVTFNNIVVNKTGASTLSTTGSISTLNVAAFTLTAGNFTAPATFAATGALTLSANPGTFTAGANTNLEGNFVVNTGATFAAGSNTVTFAGAGVKTITGTNTTTATLFDLVISAGSVLFGDNAATGRTLNISNNLTISSGSFSSGATGATAQTINLTGNLSNDGAIDFSANSATAHRLILLGTAKTIGGTGTHVFRSLRLSTTAAANVTLNSNVTVNGTLDWTADGLLVLNGTDLTFGSAATVTTPGANRYIQSDGSSALTGNVLRVNSGVVANWAFLFPIGTATNGYSPVSLTGATITTAPTAGSTLAAKAIVSSDEPGRLKRTFRLTVAGNANATTFRNGTFNYYNTGDVSGAEPIASYNTLWYQRESTGIWTRPGGTAPGTVNTAPTLSFFTGSSADQPLTNDTYYFTIGTSGAYGQTWYSYQTGNWNDPTTWTADGSSFPLLINPTNAIPGVADEVVIKSGQTVTMNINNVTINAINVVGTLNVAATTGHNLTTISGAGKIRIAGTTDNFPLGTTTNFADNAVGGTVEINGTGMQLGTLRTFNNLIINLTASTNTVVLKNNLTLNGDLTITNGTLQFEDATAPANRTLTVNGHVTVNASGNIRTFASNNRHEFSLYGDFINNGSSHFTNRLAANTAAEATDGIVDVNLFSASRDQSVACNGETRFYRIEIDKGTDDTYKASISATSAANFNLFGFANADINGATGSNSNALGLEGGTVELGANVTVLLNTTGNYSIYENAKLLVNGATVTKTGGAAIVPYGVLQVSAGSLSAGTDVPSGLTLRESGAIIVEGGTVSVQQIRTSVLGSDQIGSYIQSGGDVTVNGVTVNTNYAQFSLTYPGNVFNMSGGTLTIKGAFNSGSGRPSIYINSDPANVSVTGGTVIMEVSTNNLFTVNSRAPFWNVIMRKTGGSSTQIAIPASTSTSGDPGDETTLAPQPLVVLNDFTIEGTSSLTFLTNNSNVTVGGSFEIQNGAAYTPGTNTTTINGAGVSSLIFGNITTTQTFNNLTINKTNATDEVVINSGRPSPNAAIQVSGTLTVTNGIFNYNTFIASARGNVSLASGVTVGSSTATGRLLLNGTTDQTIVSNNSFIHNLEINNTDPTPQVTLSTNNLTIYRTLTLTAGVFDINTQKLTLNGSSANISGSGFGTAKMIQLAGNAGDGGLEMYFNANESITYPVGTNANSTVRYTPATVRTQSYADDGYVRITIEDRTLQLANLPETNSLSYNWRVLNSGFTTLPLVSLQFTYAETDADGSQGFYVPGKVLTDSPFTRSSEDASDLDAGTNVITFNGTSNSGTFPGVGFTLDNAAYTAGASGMFTGAPQIFYNRQTGTAATGWQDDTKWSLLGFNGTATTESPAAGDVVLMTNFGFANQGAWVNMDVNVEVAAVVFSNTGGGWLPRITIQNGRTVSLGVVSGTGEIMVEANGTLPILNTTDIGDFANQSTSTFIYKVENDVTYDMYTAFTEYPNLRIEGNSGGTNNGLRVMRNTVATTVNRDLRLDWGGSFRADFDITVVRDMNFREGGGGRFQFGQTQAVVATVGNDVSFTGSANGRMEVLNTTPASLVHTLKVARNITQTAGVGVIDLYNGTGTANNAILELYSTTNGTFANTSTTPDLFRLVMNKGTSTSATFTLSDNMTINYPTDQTVKAIELQNGLLILDDAAINYTLTSGGADFNIPGTAGLEVKQGAVSTSTTSTNANLTLDGLLRVSGGSVSINGGGATDTNYIQYSNSGNATIEVTGGSLTVAGQIRRDLTSTTGVLKYTQSSGTVLVGNESFDTNERGIFEVVNTGSQFNHSGGSLTIVRGHGSASIPSLWLEPASATITSGSTITIGNASTPAGTIGIQSTVALNNLTISGLAASTPQASLYVTPLTVNGTITVATGNTLNALGRDLTIGGDFTVNGTYTSGSNTTTFNNTGTGTIGGATSSLSFNNFTKTGTGILTLARNITVNRDLTVSAGTLSTATFSVDLLRHAQIDATITSTSGSGLVFGSTVQQQRLTRAASGTGTLGIVTINNANGVIIPDGNGYDFNVTTGLRLQSGVFDIGGSLLTLGTSALITPVNPYSAANLIQTNSSFTDKGVRKQFPLNYTTDFVFPVGQSNYTPVTFNFSTGGNTTGSSGAPTITVRPTNRVHPVIVDGAPAPLNDTDNMLQYYWIIGAANVSSTFQSTMSLQYTQPLVAIESAYNEEADYIAARILTDVSINPTISIQKFSAAEVNAATNVISIPLTSIVDQRSISGDYFAGVDPAIPSNVTTYTTKGGGAGTGNINGDIYTSTVFGGVPTGARIVVSDGDVVTFNVGSVILYQTVINSGGKIVIPSGSIGHSLGTLTGTGDLEINSDGVSAVLPAAEYDTFLSCSGGGLIFGGTGSYEILGGITALRNLTLNGSGDKALANNNLTICNDLTLNSGSFANSSNRVITVQNDVLLNGGTFDNAVGTLTITRDFTQAAGTFEGGTGGTKTIGRDLIIDGGTFNPGSGTTNVIRVNGNMTVDAAATITTGTGGVTGQRFTFGGSSPQVLTGDFTDVRAFNRLEINNSNGLTLVGDVTINSQLQLTNGLITPGSSRFLLGGTAVAAPTTGSATSFVNGKLYKTIPTAGSTFVFPIGKTGRWRSGSVILGVAGVNAGQTWDMEYFGGAATNAVTVALDSRANPVNNFTSADPLVLRIATGEYWRVSDGSAASNGRTARVGLSWGIDSDVSATLAQREAMKVMSWNGTDWTNNGGINFAPGGSHTQSRGTFESSASLSFSENIVTLGSSEAANPLPVELMSFTGYHRNGFNTLQWRTASETNNDYFELQRSATGEEFETVAIINGQGVTQRATDYRVDDEQPLVGKNYYRLKQVDIGGEVTYHSIILVEVEAGETVFNLSVYPNPVSAKGTLMIRALKEQDQKVLVYVRDMTGRTVASYVLEAGEEEIAIEVQERLAGGMYLVEMVGGERHVARRVLVE